MCLRFLFLLITRVASWPRLSRREKAWETSEILVLYHQIPVLQPGVMPNARDRGLRPPVTPDTLGRWHRDIVRRWAARSRRGKIDRRPAGTSRSLVLPAGPREPRI